MVRQKDTASPVTRPETEEKETALYSALEKEKAPAYAMPDGPLPMSHFSDDTFELFIGDILYGIRGRTNWDWYDTVYRFSGSADGGRDVMLHEEGLCTGTVQCKKFNSNVDLPTVLVEIAKYFLHATFNTSLISPRVECFRWYLAASEGTTSPATVFLAGEGKSHLDGYRDQLARAAVKARDNNAYLKSRTELATLGGTELCDLIWERLCSSRFGFLRRSELSSFVQTLPDVKQRYYKLQSVVTGDMTEVMERLEKIVGLLHRVPHDEEEARGITTSFIPHTLFRGDSLNLALLPACDEDSLPILARLLKDKCEEACGSEPVIIVTGANAFRPEQFDDVEALINTTTHPVVIVAGCGRVRGKTLNQWKEDSVLLFPDQAWKASIFKQYHAGWCWVRLSSDSTQCHIMIENVSADPSFGQGSHHLCLVFKDTHFWPALGHDFFCGWEPTRGLLRRLFLTMDEGGENRRHIVALCACDGSRSVDIRQSMSNTNMLSSLARICLLMCHPGSTNYGPGLRSMSGVFPGSDTSYEMLRTQTFIPDGVVLRSPGTVLAIMAVRWMKDSTQIGAVQAYCLKDNTLEDDFPALMTELLNVIGAYSERIPPGSIARASQEFSQQYLTDKGMSARLFVHHCLRQLAIFSESSPDDVMLSQNTFHIAKLAELNSYLRQHHDVEWQTDSQRTGTLKWQDSHSPVHFIALENPLMASRQFQAQIAEWIHEPGEHPYLHVLASGWGSIDEGAVNPSEFPRSDVSATPPSSDHRERDVAECNTSRKASLSALNELDNLFLKDADISQIDAFLLRMRTFTQ